MPQDANAAQKSDQIAHRFFTKTVLVADHARNVSSQQQREDTAAKVDKWFNLETPDNELYKDQLRIYRSLSQLGASPPPLFFRVFLAVPELTGNQVLVQHPPNSSRIRVEPTPSHILLESWSLTFRATNGSSSQLSSVTTPSTSSSGEVSLATVYKHIMSVIRSMYTMLRVLPAWRIIKRLRRRPGSTRPNGQPGVELRVQTQGDEELKYLDFGTPLAPGSSPLPSATHTFSPIIHPMGIFSLAVTYLTNPHFEVDTLEALLSSRFLSMDAGPDFTPTLARGTTRDSSSITGSPASLALRTSLPRSPPQDRTGAGTSVADRFIYSAGALGTEASGSRASFPSTSPRSRGAALPPVSAVQRSISAQTPGVSAGAASNSGPGSGQGSLSSESRLSREDGREGGLSSLHRIRRESTGMGRGSDLPSSPGPVLIRRPSTTVNPFKSSTLSSGSPSLHSNSPSFRHASPLPSLPSVPAGRAAPVPLSPTNARASSSRVGTEVDFPSSPISGLGTVQRPGPSPFPSLRPSPPSPFVPSSLGDRRFPSTPATPGLTAGGEGAEPIATPPRRKRYSSSFGYRYAAGASDGSAGSGEKGKESERPSPSYLGNQTDDDDLRAFVQEIENSRPLGRGMPVGLSNLALGHERERTLSEAGLAGRAVLAGGDFPSSSSRPSLTSRTSASGDNSRHHRTSSDSVGVIGLGIGTPLRRESMPSPSLPSSPGTRESSGLSATRAPQFEDSGAGIAIESKLREMTDAFQASMGRVERRPSTVVEASETSSTTNSTATSTSTAAYTTASERERDRPSTLGPSPFPPYNPGPGAAHLRMPSYNAAIGISTPRSARRTVTTPSLSSSSSTAPVPPNEVPGSGSGSGAQSGSGSGVGYPASIWDNRRGRPRTDSAGSGASNISVLERERERARMFYGQGHVARGSVGSVGGASHGTGGSVGSEEVIGRMEMDR